MEFSRQEYWSELPFPTLLLTESESENHSVVSSPLQPHGLYSSWNSPGQNTGVGSRFLLHGIFPSQGSNPDLPHFRQILYPLSHRGSPGLALKYSHEIKWLYFQVATPVLVDSFHLIPGTQVSRDKTLWVGKRSWKSRSNDKIEQTKTWQIRFIQWFLQKIVARKVSSQVALRNCSKVLRGARVHKVMGRKNIQKASKDYSGW